VTIRIVREGKLPEDKDYTGTCNYCSTVIECKQRDGELKYAHQLDGGGGYISLKCPKCNRTMQASEKKTMNGYSGQYWDR
jgi:hypothetical protein